MRGNLLLECWKVLQKPRVLVKHPADPMKPYWLEDSGGTALPSAAPEVLFPAFSTLKGLKK